MKADQVTAIIEEAFPLSPLPKMTLPQAHLADDSMARDIPKDEWDSAGKLDANRTWKEFSDEELMLCDTALAHMDEESFVYYLPAFLLFALRHCNVAWSHPASTLVGSAVFSVTHRSPYSLSRFKKFTPEQREAVVCFLEYMTRYGDDHNASHSKKALERYWKTDEAGKPLIIVP